MTVQAIDDDPLDVPARVDLALWRRIAEHLTPYRNEVAGLVVAGLVAAAVDTSLPLLTATLVDGAVAGRPLSALLPVAGLFVGLLAVLALAVFGFIRLAGRIATGVAHDLRRGTFSQLQDLSFSWFDEHPVGLLVARVIADVNKVSGLLPWLMLDTVWGSALLLGIVGAMLSLDAGLALVVLLVVPPLVALSLIFQRLMLRSSRLVRRSNARITASFNEGIMGVRTTRALARERESLGEHGGLTGEMYHHSVRNALQGAVYLPLVILLGNVGVGLALWQGGLLVAHDALSLGTLIAFMQYATLFAMPIQDMARQFTLMQSAQAAAERVQSLLETEPGIVERPDPVVPPQPLREIVFDRVSFAYTPDEPVLSDVSFTVRAGWTVALVGPTGGGKSTIVKLLSRFYDVSGGAIRIDGVDLRDLPLSWLARRFGIVLQTPHLFTGTLASNIRYGRLDATDDEVRAAARLAHADRFIDQLPRGYDTEVGEGGASLSTGQRQLVSLARAVLADPQIFVMDEATSSVDTETERAIQAGVDALLEDRIAFVIAHRLSTIRRADHILVVRDGRIAEAGTHDELVARGGHYAGLVAAHAALG